LKDTVVLGSSLAILSGLMNGAFTLPMWYLGRWEWENVWSVFVVTSCLILPAVIISIIAPQSWIILAHAPAHAVWIAVLTGFGWGFGSILFGQSVSAVGISLANTLVLAISSALGALLPILLLAPRRILSHTGAMIMTGVAIEIAGIVLCGRAGWLRERAAGVGTERGAMVGHARTMRTALLMAIGSGILSAVFNIGFSLAQPIAAYGRSVGLSEFSSTNLIWSIMLGAGSIANLGFCAYLLTKNRSLIKFRQRGSLPLYALSALMALLWGGSIFVYGAAAPKLGPLGTSIGWPLSLATGLILANLIGVGLGEWRTASSQARVWMYSAIFVLVVAVVILSRAGA
jgi:L-rhamnose-H+ transport protein